MTIASPAASSTVISAVKIAASAKESGGFHLEIWDNGTKLGDVLASSVDDIYVLPNGSHTLTVNAVSDGGSLLSADTVHFKVEENCTNSTTQLCNVDQAEGMTPDAARGLCNPPQEMAWVAADCSTDGVEGKNSSLPASTTIRSTSETGGIPDVGNTTLNGTSVHLSEVQGHNGFSNVLFSSAASTKYWTRSTDTHWTLDEYVNLPNPLAHQAFETDLQYVSVGGGVWSKFYTECAFNESGTGLASTGYWAVYDRTGGWIFLNGVEQNGQTPPKIPCSRSQFARPFASGSNESTFSGWHHIVWKFLINNAGTSSSTTTFQTLTFDNDTYEVNFTPKSAPGGTGEGNTGDFGPLVQLDGASNTSGDYDTVDAYISELNITHTP